MTTPLLVPARINSYRSHVLRDNPTFFYDFSDTTFTTGTVKDLSGNKNDGTNSVQTTTPLQAVGQIGNQRCALFPFVGTNNARIQSPVNLTVPELTVETTVCSAQYGYTGANVRFLADGHTDQGGSSRAGFEFYMPNSSQSLYPDGAHPNQGQLGFIIGNGYNKWTVSTAYTVGQRVNDNGNVYQCTTAGTSASTGNGPSGTGSGIVDGTVVWDYVTLDNLNCSSGNTNLLPGQIYHLMGTVVVSGITTTMTIYINGKQVGQNTATNFGNVTSPNQIGVGFNPSYTGDFFCGWMGAAAAYDYGLTASQVLAHSNAFFAGVI